MKFTYIGTAEVETLGRVVKPGDVVEVSPEVGGWVESRTVLDDDGAEVTQTYGEGLAAQPDLWQPVKTTTKKES